MPASAKGAAQRNSDGPGVVEFRGLRACTTRPDAARGKMLGRVEEPAQDRLCVIGSWRNQSPDGRRVLGHQACREAIAAAMQEELRPFGIQVQTINPGPFLTGFNETMVEAAYRWLDDGVTFAPCAMVKDIMDGLLAKPEGRLEPNDMIAKMIELIADQRGPLRKSFRRPCTNGSGNTKRAMLERTI
jgi:NAD(P)-dependent dehydrogenase (short-subunit alcohol dehydrogenase family)